MNMVHNILKISILSVISVALVGCHQGHQHEHEGLDHSEEIGENHHEHHSTNGVSFSVEMQQGIDFEVSPAQLRPLGNVIRAVAQVQPAQGDAIMLTAKVDGVIGGLSGQWSEGVEIKAGQTLCVIDASASPADNLQLQQVQAATEYERAKRELDRLTELHKDKLVLESEWLQARANFEQAEAVYEALHKGYGTGRQSVSVSQSGYIVNMAVVNGQHVSKGDLIAVVSRP